MIRQNFETHPIANSNLPKGQLEGKVSGGGGAVRSRVTG